MRLVDRWRPTSGVVPPSRARSPDVDASPERVGQLERAGEPERARWFDRSGRMARGEGPILDRRADRARWLLPGESVEVAGHHLPGGMVYVGRRLVSATGREIEPALVNPHLSLDDRWPDNEGRYLDYWPSYTSIPPASRAAYLRWLSEGRRRPDTPLGYVFLFLYGLERRIFVDLRAGFGGRPCAGSGSHRGSDHADHADHAHHAAHAHHAVHTHHAHHADHTHHAGHADHASRADDPCGCNEVSALRAEVQDLLDVYGHHRSFRRYASQCRDALDVAAALAATGRRADRGQDAAPERGQDAGPDHGTDLAMDPAPNSAWDPAAFPIPPLLRPRSPAPGVLRLALGAFAARAEPVPVRWALPWAWHHPDIAIRRPAVRCPDEFARLFAQRYTDRFPDGLEIHEATNDLRLEYRPASAGISPTGFEPGGLPDAYSDAACFRALTALVEDVTAELGAFSRRLARQPDERHSLATAALLPAELVADAGPVAPFRTWLEHRLGATSSTVLDAADLLAWWPTANAGTITRSDAIRLTQLLSHLGYGVEPDVRMGGPVLAKGAAVVFRSEPDSPREASQTYAAATALLRLVMAVGSGGDGAPGAQHEHESPGGRVGGAGSDDTGGNGGDDARRANGGGRGDVGSYGTRRLVDHVRSVVPLSGAEGVRLEAHLRWLAAAASAVSERAHLAGPGRRSRLAGERLSWLRTRLAALPEARRAAAGELLISVAASGGNVTPHQVDSLTRIYELLSLDPAVVPSRLHAALTVTSRRPADRADSTSGPANRAERRDASPYRSDAHPLPMPASAPVAVRPGGPPPPGFAIPTRPDDPPTDVGSDREPGDDLVTLDPRVLDAKLAETRAVSALLADIFADDDTGQASAGAPLAPVPSTPAPSAPTTSAPTTSAPTTSAPTTAVPVPATPAPPAPDSSDHPSVVALVPGLDAPHLALLRALSAHETWTRADFDHLVARLGLLPAGALDVLNEAAVDASGEPVAEDDGDLAGDIEINAYALRGVADMSGDTPVPTRIRPRERDAIVQSLRAGVVPRTGQQHIQVGRAAEVEALLADIDRIADGGSGIRFVIGEYGSGKTFFLHLVRSIALQKRLVTVHADLSPDRRLHATGGQARGLYAELMRNIATRAKPDGGALASVVERFVTQALTEATRPGRPPETVIARAARRVCRS